MTRSKTILSALLCSASLIPLTAEAAMSRATDWHVAPVLAAGKNTAPYCALSANYPDAGVIVTHARNKHGGGTIAFDFRRASFEPREYYGIEVRFDHNVRTFAAEARTKNLLVVEMQRDPALYAALDAGKDMEISVQQGGPEVALAGNTRLFFQLNYCVQALNDEAPGQAVAMNEQATPSFGLQQPAAAPIPAAPLAAPVAAPLAAPVALKPPVQKPLVLRPPVAMEDLNQARLVVRSTPYPRAVAQVAPVARPSAPVATPHVAQAATAQDGDQSRSDLENMLKNARQDEKTKPVRQKLSSISSSDDADPNTMAPINRNARQSLLFDDPNAANSYVPPRLGQTETTAEKQPPAAPVKKVIAPAPAPVAQKPVTLPPPAVISARPEAAPTRPVTPPVPPVIAKVPDKAPDVKTAPAPIAAPSAALLKDDRPAVAKSVPAPVSAPTTHAMPAPLPLPDDNNSDFAAADVRADELVARMKAATMPPTNIVSDKSRTVLASDYLKEKQDGTPAPEFNRAAADKAVADAKEAGKEAKKDVAAAKKAATATASTSPSPITWDKPAAVTTALAPAPVASTPVKAPVIPAATDEKTPAIASTALSAPVENAFDDPKPGIFSGRPAAIRSKPALDIGSVTTSRQPVATAHQATPATTPTTPVEKQAKADHVETMTTPAPVAATPIVVTPVAKSLAAEAVVAEKPAAPVVVPAVSSIAVPPPAKTVAKDVVESVKDPVIAMPAPALPPPIIEESAINMNVRGPMRPATEAVNVTFPGESIDDNLDAMPDTDVAMAPAATKPLPVPAAMLQTTRFKAIDFKPPASKAARGWDVSTVSNGKNGAGFCVMKNSFINQQSLFLSRSADGNATLGLDYGMDLLQTDRDYKTTVQLDNLFAEDFVGQARKPNLLVVQMGRKDSFFNALTKAKALHVAMEGGASTFDVQDAQKHMSAFNSCTLGQGGAPLPGETPVAQDDSIIETPVIEKPVVTATPKAVPQAETAKPVAEAPKAMSFSISSPQVTSLLQKAQIHASVRSDSQGYKWGSSLDPVQGQMQERRFMAGKADLMEAAMRDMDQAERDCGSSNFSSEVGMPEQHGQAEELVAELRCRAGNQTSIQAVLYQRIGEIFRVWNQKGPESSRESLIRQRDRLSQIMQDDDSLLIAKK